MSRYLLLPSGRPLAFLAVLTAVTVCSPSQHLFGSPQQGSQVDSVTIGISVSPGWNMLSNPVITASDTTFPICCYGIFCYNFCWDTYPAWRDCDFRHGRGWFIKCQAGGTGYVTGVPISTDTVSVTSGWNLIGSISYPVDTSAVVLIPPGLRESVFWLLHGGRYFIADSIRPGLGYWVKMRGPGTLVLTAGIRAQTSEEVIIPKPD